MPRVSKDSAANVEDWGTTEDRHEELEDFTVNFVTFREEADHAPLLRGLPDDRCQCPHWGYVLAGTLTISYADRTEVIGVGDAFYLPPGHVPSTTAGTEIVLFSPTEELQATEEAMLKNLHAMGHA